MDFARNAEICLNSTPNGKQKIHEIDLAFSQDVYLYGFLDYY